MKITDEQRDGWKSYIGWANSNKFQQVTVDVTAIESLLSSEQAWKEEAERWKNSAWSSLNDERNNTKLIIDRLSPTKEDKS